jgi:low-density lipoprotein receptor-related protein 1 (alpha-2-macroglobulin receptor)
VFFFLSEASPFAAPVANLCNEFQFQCKSDGFCIPAQWKCDFVNDCNDGSDESISECERTSFVQNECDNEDFFHCQFSRKCILKKWVCDGDNDCGLIGKFNLLDDSDENQNCTKQCPINTLPCSNGVCIHISKFCDGHVDCQNDEAFCTDKTLCKNLKCDYECKTTPHGPQCYCPPNQSIINGTKCIVQKECIENISEDGDVCDQLCMNSNGRNKCLCVNGYEQINHKCYGINGKLVQLNYHPYILFFMALLRSHKKF